MYVYTSRAHYVHSQVQKLRATICLPNRSTNRAQMSHVAKTAQLSFRLPILTLCIALSRLVSCDCLMWLCVHTVCLPAGSLTCLEVLPRPSVSLGLPVVRSGPAARTGAAGAGAKGHALTGALPPAPHYKPQLAHRSLFDLMNHTRTSVGT